MNNQRDIQSHVKGNDALWTKVHENLHGSIVIIIRGYFTGENIMSVGNIHLNQIRKDLLEVLYEEGIKII